MGDHKNAKGKMTYPKRFPLLLSHDHNFCALFCVFVVSPPFVSPVGTGRARAAFHTSTFIQASIIEEHFYA
jgi:hypothetical protein